MGNSIILPPDYVPNKKEEYMNEMQLEYFRQKLLDWKKDLLNQSSGTLEDLRQGGLNQPDDVDRASLETDKSIDLRTKDRARKLIIKIDQALDRIEDGTYGYCEETGDEIGIDRLWRARLPRSVSKRRNAMSVWKKPMTTRHKRI